MYSKSSRKGSKMEGRRDARMLEWWCILGVGTVDVRSATDLQRVQKSETTGRIKSKVAKEKKWPPERVR